MKIKKYFILSSLIISCSAFAQTLPDAIKKTTNEQFEKADADFKKLLEAQPNNGEIYFYQGENHFKEGNFELANASYQKGVEQNATNPLPYVGLGKVQWVQNKNVEAKANFYKATTLAAGKNATVLLKIAEAYITEENKDFAEATKLLDQAQKLEPKNPEIFILRGDAFLEQSNDGSKAIASYEEAAKLDPKSVKAILRIGQLWNRAKNYTSALDYYKKASLVDSSFAPAYREMAEIFARAGQFNNAVAKYKRFLEINNDCDARSRYAGFLLEAKKYTDAIDVAKEALKCNAENIYTYRYLAYAFYEATPADYTAGLNYSNTFFTKVKPGIKLISKDYEYHAKLLSKGGQDSLAILDYMKAMELEPEKSELYSDIANAYIKMKKYPEAIAAFDKKIAAGKGGINDYFGLTRAYYFSKDFVKADSATSQMIRLQPDLPIGYLWKAKVNVQQDPKNEKWLAKPYYEQFIAKVKPAEVDRSKKDLIDAYTYLGVHYMLSKDFKTAKINFQKVLDLDPQNQNAMKFMNSPEGKQS
jgi:tetratricopeptide (TPR) repeat protein